MIWVLIVIAAVAIVGVWFIITRQNQQETGVESFRRHIDALSPEARREVMDRVRPPENGGGNGNGNRHGNDPGITGRDNQGGHNQGGDDPDGPEG